MKGKGSGELQPGETEVRTLTREKVRAGGMQLALEAWLTMQGGRPDVAKILVYKRNPMGRWSQIRKAVLEPPFDTDPETLFAEHGDGEYKFLPVNVQGRLLDSRIEAVTGYGPEAKAGGQRAATSNVIADLAELVELKKQEYLMARYDTLLAGMGGAGAVSLTMEERQALRQDNMDHDLERMLKLRALLEPKEGAGGIFTVLETLLPKLVERLVSPPDPADRQLDFVTKVLDLKDRLGGPFEGGELPDWKSLGVLVLAAVLGTNPRLQETINRIVPQLLPPARPAPGAPTPGAPAALPTATEPARVTVVPPAAAPAPGTPAADPAIQHAIHAVLTLLRQAIEKNSRDPELYASLADEHLPGFLDEWTRLDQEQAIGQLAHFDPFFGTEPAVAWLKAWWQFLKEEYLVQGGDTPPAGTQP